MNESELYETMFKRRSVRKYAGPLDRDAMDRVDMFNASLRPLFPGIRTELRTLSSDELKGPFKVDAPHFLAIYSEPKDGYLVNAGFMLQQADLFLSSSNIGSCWLGGARPTKKTNGSPGLEFVISLAFGPPAGEVHRKSVEEFRREPLDEITDIAGMDALLEPVRLAPSANNNQPWYFTGGDGIMHAHYARRILLERMNQVSVGIALCHLWLAAAHAGKSVEFVRDGGEGRVPKRYSYAASAVLK